MKLVELPFSFTFLFCYVYGGGFSGDKSWTICVMMGCCKIIEL